VIVGVSIGCVLDPLEFWFSAMNLIVVHAMGIATIVVPMLVGYGVLRHRVVDVGFVVSRTAVYGVVVAVLAGGLGLAKLVGGTYLKGGWAIALQVAAAIGLGLSTQRLYKVADWLVDRYLYPKTREMETRLNCLGDGLKYAESTEVVAGALTIEAVDALDLASAAVFRRLADGSYVRRAAVGWDGAGVDAIAAIDPLTAYFEGAREKLDLRALFSHRAGFPQGAAAPQHGFALLVAHAVHGFVLYSDHLDGTALDPEEIAMLDKLVKAAGDGYHPLLRIRAALRTEHA
jgi:hypothetical protein